MDAADRADPHLLRRDIVQLLYLFLAVPVSAVRGPENETSSAAKKLRNVIYISCGAAMVFCMLWAAYGEFTHMSIFWPEALLLGFFAVSWLVKGRAYSTAVAAGKQSLFYGLHPGQLIKDIVNAVRR